MNWDRIAFISRLALLITVFSGLLYQSSAVRIVLNTNYILNYNLINSNRSIEFRIEANNITGWVGIGVNNRTSGMAGSDLYIGGYNATNRMQYGDDYHVPATAGNTRPTRDPVQNWDRVSVTESGNKTILVVRRLLNSTDKIYDLDIQNKTMWLIWAYHNTSDNVATKHTVKGSRQINFLAGSGGGTTPPTRPTVPTRPPVTTRTPTTTRATTTTKRSDAGLIRNGLKTSFTSILIVYSYYWMTLY